MRKKTFHKQPGFSLVELLVSMAIIAVLLGLVGFGIATAQRNSRDSQRRQVVSDMKIGLEDFLLRANEYPEAGDIVYSSGQLVMTLPNDEAITIKIDGPASPASATSTTSTQYCFARDATGGYTLGAKLENNDWYDSSSTISGEGEVNDNDCPENSGAFVVAIP